MLGDLLAAAHHWEDLYEKLCACNGIDKSRVQAVNLETCGRDVAINHELNVTVASVHDLRLQTRMLLLFPLRLSRP